MSESLLTNNETFEMRQQNWSSSSRMDAILLAGTHKNPKRLILGKNKAFLKINEKPLIRYVVLACLKTKRIGKVVVVGPRNDLKRELKDLTDEYGERLIIIQQRSRILENVYNGFLATFDDGNNLPVNKRIETLLLGGHIPIKKKAHLHLIKSVYAAVAGQMNKHKRYKLRRGAVLAAMERRFDEFRARFERQEWFMGKMGVEILLAEGHILIDTDEGIAFREAELLDYFSDWERRFQKPVFVTGSDLPLLEPCAIEDFLDRCNPVSGDFFIGVSSEAILKHFYTDFSGVRSFRRPYLSFREAEVRAANLIVVRPNRVGNKELIQESFGIRKMTEWRNVLAMIWKLLRLSGRYQTIRMAAMLQLVAVLKRHGFNRSAARVRGFIRCGDFEKLLSRIFMTKIKLIESPYGTASLDVDDEKDYETLRNSMEYWRKIQIKIIDNIQSFSVDEFQRIGCFQDLDI